MAYSYKDQSKLGWARDDGRYPNIDQLKFGALQRIADATEKMASSYENLRVDRDYYKGIAESRWDAMKKLERSNAALRGVITKLKKEAGNGG